MNTDQLETIINEIGFDLQELKKELALQKEQLTQHIKEFDAHKEPIWLPKWMRK